jgi:hypothetical protein
MTPKPLLTSDAVPADISRSAYCQVTQSLLTTDAVPTDKSRSILLTSHAVPLLTSYAVGTASDGSIRSSSRRLKPFTKTLSRRGFREFLHFVVHEDTHLVATCGRELAQWRVVESEDNPSRGSR